MCEQGSVKDLTVVDPTGTGEAPVSREGTTEVDELIALLKQAPNPAPIITRLVDFALQLRDAPER